MIAPPVELAGRNQSYPTMKNAIVSTLCIAGLLSGCATSSKDVATVYVSPIQYQTYTCEQMEAETARIQVRVNQLAGRLDEAAANDKALVGVGMLVFWPALFALGGTKGQEAEYARLKGEHDAIQQMWIQKQCKPTEKPATLTATSGTSNSLAGSVVSVGDKLVYAERDAISGASIGELSVSLSSLGAEQVGFNDEAILLGKDGKLRKGALTGAQIYGVGPGMASTLVGHEAVFRVADGAVPDETVTLKAVGPEQRTIDGRNFSAVRLAVSGYASRRLIDGVVSTPQMGAPVSGYLVVEAASGLPLEVKVKSAHPFYNIDRTLTRVSR